MNTTIQNKGTYTVTYCPGTVKERKESFEFSVTNWSPNPELPDLIKIELHEYHAPAPHNIFYIRKEDKEVSWN